MRTMSIAKGELLLCTAGAAVQSLESPFAKEVIERDARSRRNVGWKNAPREEQSGVIPSASLWGQRGAASGVMTTRFLHVCPTDDPQVVYYVLAVGDSVGLFRRHLDEEREVRLFHRKQWDCLGLCFNPSDRRLVAATRNADGTGHLEVYDEEGNLKGSVTGGDCLDSAPSMVPGQASTLLYQSSGVARHPQSGNLMAFGHSTVNRLNYANGQLDTLLDDTAFDFLAPRIDRQGTLYAIRRPIEKPTREKAGGFLKDTLMMPFRLAQAVFGYLNFFTMVYGKEPLRSAGGPRTPELDQDLGQLWLHGRMIQLSKVRHDPQFAGNLVPRSWELVRKAPGRALEVLMPHVASFDLASDGSVLYTNGYDLLVWREGTSSPLGRHELVEAVRAG